MILYARSHFSPGESLLTPKEIVHYAIENNYQAVALADTMTVSGTMEFAELARAAGIKPIVGCRVRVVKDPRVKDKTRKKNQDGEWFIDLYCRTGEGFKALLKLLTKAYSEEYFYYVPRVSLDDVCEALSGNALVAVSSDVYSVFHQKDYTDIMFRLKDAVNVSQRVGDELPLLLRLVLIDTPLYDTLNNRVIGVADILGLKVIATHTAHYKSLEDADALDVYRGIITNTPMSAPYRRIPWHRDSRLLPHFDISNKLKKSILNLSKYYSRNEATVESVLGDPDSLAAMTDFAPAALSPSLPKLASNEFNALVKLCAAGWSARFKQPVLGHQPSREDLETVYKARLKRELNVLKDLGFCGYFLLVQDLVIWAKSQGIIVGPGRGSAAGSLVAYLIGITDVDPIRFDLLFERFINPERLDLPDADLDFMSSRRHEIINYLIDKYGRNRVAGIANYTLLASSSALRDVARIHGLSHEEMKATTLIPKPQGKPLSLEAAAEEVSEVAAFKDRYPQIWAHALRLEGRLRSLSRHAAGVVVAGEDLVNRAIVETRTQEAAVNWDKRAAETLGLVKLDVLGLSNLDMIKVALDYIEERHKVRLDLLAMPLDDRKTLEAMGQGDTTGVFQLESGGMKGLLKQLRMGGELTFKDIMACNALYRPGPMESGLLDDYVAIKQGVKIPIYEHPNMEEALKDTGGVIVFQEQVMQMARDLAGFTMAEADFLRKAMGKKDPVKMASMREKWVEGCRAHSSLEKQKAERLFDKIEKFAGYAFNASHSCAYSVVSFWTMYLKTHYPAEFFAASLSVMKEDKLSALVKNAEKKGFAVVPPDVNQSSDRFEIGFDASRDQHILITPFNRIKGVSDNGARALMEARARCKGQFGSLEQFEQSVVKRLVNVRVKERLDRVGAFASLVPGQLPARHPDRLRDQIELLPGLINPAVKAERGLPTDKFIKARIASIVKDYQGCEQCPLTGTPHPLPRFGARPKIMLVADYPDWAECDSGKQDEDGRWLIQPKLLEGKTSSHIRAAIRRAGLSTTDIYATTLVKAKKPEEGLGNAIINACSGYLRQELELLKPPVIITLGSAARRFFLPDLKGSVAETVGTTAYDSARDATIIVGLNTAQIFFDPDKQGWLDEVLEKAAELVME